MANDRFDLVVIGSGPGGYVAALRAAQLGMKVACVEKNASLGGTCLNVGCIPSKALLESSEKFAEAKHDLGGHGVRVGSVELDLAAMQKRKEGIVKRLTGGVAFLFKRAGIERVQGTGRLAGAGSVEAGGRTLTAERILVATGSVAAAIEGVELDGDRVVTSTEALAFKEVPGHLVVIGAGVIGLELGSVWARLGAKVTVLEYMKTILPGVDSEVATAAQKIFEKQGLEFVLGARVKSAVKGRVAFDDPDGKAREIEGDKVLVAVGRKPNTEGLGAEGAGVRLDGKGRVVVNERFESSVRGVYAIGDVIAGPMLAHKASEEGIAAVEMMATGRGHVAYDAIPNVVYTHPEIASVGKSEEQLKADGVPYKRGTFPFRANGRALSLGAADGFVKVLAHEKNDRILGVHIIGARAGDLVAEGALSVEFMASAEDLGRAVAAHPTLAEIVKEAALATDGRALHA